MIEHPDPSVIRFGDFEVDLRSGELRKRGLKVALQGRPLQVLEALVRRPGQVVTRDALRQELWGSDTFVDFESGLNAAVRRLRDALGDAADIPRFVETLPRRGYRFIAPVQAVAAADTDSLGPGVPLPLPERERTAPVRIAVLPFENLTGDANRDYLADGLTDETIATLGQSDPAGIVVIGRTSMMRYRRTTRSLAEIGRELDADYVVESSVRIEGDRLRATTGLVRARDQVQLWSRSYERELTSVLDLQKAISAGIAEQVRSWLSPLATAGVARRQTANPQAYDCYLRALFMQRLRTPAAVAAAIRLFEEATALDPNLAQAWCALTDIHVNSGLSTDAPPAVSAPRARDAAARAVLADPQLADAQAASGRVRFWFDWDWPAGEQALRQALVLSPTSAEIQRFLAFTYASMGRHAEALAATQAAVEHDPLNPVQHGVASEVAFRRGDFDAALTHAGRSLQLEPRLWIGHILAAQAHEQLGEHERALAGVTTAQELSGNNSKPIALRGYILAKSGSSREAEATLLELARQGEARYVPPCAAAMVYAGLGDADAMFASLEHAYAVRDVHLVMMTVDPKWDAYRDDPRFQSLMRRCGFAVSAGARLPA
jgi:TolB-like protein/Flp pilus assembly protein TadD